VAVFKILGWELLPIIRPSNFQSSVFEPPLAGLLSFCASFLQRAVGCQLHWWIYCLRIMCKFADCVELIEIKGSFLTATSSFTVTNAWLFSVNTVVEFFSDLQLLLASLVCFVEY
jgi:hypothetical protein